MRLSVVICAALLSIAPASGAELGIEGTSFTIDGKPTFLLGISYYGALGASEETIRKDLAEMKRLGFNWMRMWATWAAFDNDVSAVNGGGDLRPEHLKKLQALVAECDKEGIVGAVKFELSAELDGVILSFISNRSPVFGDIFIKGGQGLLTNTGYQNVVSDNVVDYIARPNGVIPEPTTLGLLGVAAVVVGRRRR